MTNPNSSNQKFTQIIITYIKYHNSQKDWRISVKYDVLQRLTTELLSSIYHLLLLDRFVGFFTDKIIKNVSLLYYFPVPQHTGFDYSHSTLFVFFLALWRIRGKMRHLQMTYTVYTSCYWISISLSLYHTNNECIT